MMRENLGQLKEAQRNLSSERRANSAIDEELTFYRDMKQNNMASSGDLCSIKEEDASIKASAKKSRKQPTKKLTDCEAISRISRHMRNLERKARVQDNINDLSISMDCLPVRSSSCSRETEPDQSLQNLS